MTPKQLAANQRRTLASMSQRLRAMAEAWEEVDNYNQTRCDEIADVFDDAIEQLQKLADDFLED